MPNSRRKPTPEPPDDNLNPTPMPPESADDGCVGPAESAEIAEIGCDESPAPMMFRFGPEAIAAYLNFAFHANPEVQGWIDDFRADGRPHMVEHFREAYQSIVHDVEEAFETRPDITPQQLMQRVFDLTRWHESPYSEVGGEAHLSEAAADRKFAWDVAHIAVFDLLGGAAHAPGEEEDDEDPFDLDPTDQGVCALPSDAGLMRQLQDREAYIDAVERQLIALRRRVAALEAPEHEATDPAQDIELTDPGASRARHEALLGALRLAHRALQHSSEALASYTHENAMADVAQPYAETYASTLANLAELVRQRPDVTPEDLVQIMETRCEMPQESLGETARRIEPGANPCPWQFGQKEAHRDVLTLLTTLLQPVPTALESSEREHRRGFAHAPEEIVRLVEEGLRTAPETTTLRKDMYEDESQRHMQQPFESAYALAVNDLRTAFASEPNLTPDGLFRRLWVAQRQFDSGVLAEDREIALCTHRIEQSYALIHGYQAALTVLTRLVPIDRP